MSTTPSYKETGVRDDVEISITFSKPMNTDSVRRAYVSDELPEGTAAQLSWTDNDTRLVITHAEPLEYAEVVSLDELPKEYRVTIGGTATDAEGHALGKDFKLPFYTLRDVTQDIARQGARELTHPHDGTADSSEQRCSVPAPVSLPVWAGDNDEDAALAFAISFGLADGIVEWESAILEGPFTIEAQNPFPESRLGELWAYRALTGLRDLTWTSPTNSLGSAAQFASQQRFELDVLTGIADHYEDRAGQPFVVLLKFQHDTNADGIEQSITGDCDQTSLHVEYLAP